MHHMAGASAEERGQTHENNRDGLYLLFQALAPTFKFNACNCHLTLRICIVIDVHSDRNEFSGEVLEAPLYKFKTTYDTTTKVAKFKGHS